MSTAELHERISAPHAPVQAPKANAYAERWVCTVRAECLDWLLIVGRGHPEQILRIYVRHYNGHRPHRVLGLQPPDQPAGLTDVAEDQQGRLRRRDLLGGLLHEYAELHERICHPSSRSLKVAGSPSAALHTA